jgi:hypothetical protein
MHVMHAYDLCELGIEQEEYLVELLSTPGACELELLARELDFLCRAYSHSSTSPSSVADCASRSSLSLR